MSKIIISKDTSEETWGYQLIDDSGEEILSGDGYETSEEALKDVTTWGNCIVSALSDPDGVLIT